MACVSGFGTLGVQADFLYSGSQVRTLGVWYVSLLPLRQSNPFVLKHLEISSDSQVRTPGVWDMALLLSAYSTPFILST
jgi:hypothetical protein